MKKLIGTLVMGIAVLVSQPVAAQYEQQEPQYEQQQQQQQPRKDWFQNYYDGYVDGVEHNNPQKDSGGFYGAGYDDAQKEEREQQRGQIPKY
ncbi:MAG: hypothetical protein ACLPT6_04875 [Desulfobaccales bacterium]